MTITHSMNTGPQRAQLPRLPQICEAIGAGESEQRVPGERHHSHPLHHRAGCLHWRRPHPPAGSQCPQAAPHPGGASICAAALSAWSIPEWFPCVCGGTGDATCCWSGCHITSLSSGGDCVAGASFNSWQRAGRPAGQLRGCRREIQGEDHFYLLISLATMPCSLGQSCIHPMPGPLHLLQ